VVVELETIVAIDIAAILGIKIAEDWSELIRMNPGSKVGDDPAAKSANAVKTLILQGSEHGFPPGSALAGRIARDLRQLAPDAGKYWRFRLAIPFGRFLMKRNLRLTHLSIMVLFLPFILLLIKSKTQKSTGSKKRFKS